jgi:membrane protease YdiL (CAAX protease family)
MSVRTGVKATQNSFRRERNVSGVDDKTGFGVAKTTLAFGLATVVLLLETQFVIPFMSNQTGLEPVVFWFIVAGLGLFFPMLVVAFFTIKSEGLKLEIDSWRDRLRFRKMNKADWLWSLFSVISIGVLSLAIIKLLESILGKVESHPPFMYFEPLTPGRYWILLLWIPYWILNMMGEEVLWRGVILPKQEIVFGKKSWLIQGIFWGVFHIAFGWQILLTLVPILFILPYVVQRRRNSWIGVVVHAVINAPSFLAISFGLL